LYKNKKPKQRLLHLWDERGGATYLSNKTVFYKTIKKPKQRLLHLWDEGEGAINNLYYSTI